jgi:hypothetical protein
MDHARPAIYEVPEVKAHLEAFQVRKEVQTQEDLSLKDYREKVKEFFFGKNSTITK